MNWFRSDQAIPRTNARTPRTSFSLVTPLLICIPDPAPARDQLSYWPTRAAWVSLEVIVRRSAVTSFFNAWHIFPTHIRTQRFLVLWLTGAPDQSGVCPWVWIHARPIAASEARASEHGWDKNDASESHHRDVAVKSGGWRKPEWGAEGCDMMLFRGRDK